MNAPTISINSLSYTSTDFIDLAARAYRKLSDLHETGSRTGVKDLLVAIEAIAPDDWKKYPSGYRKLSTRLLNATIVLQAVVGDGRDLQGVVEFDLLLITPEPLSIVLLEKIPLER